MSLVIWEGQNFTISASSVSKVTMQVWIGDSERIGLKRDQNGPHPPIPGLICRGRHPKKQEEKTTVMKTVMTLDSVGIRRTNIIGYSA